jgi:hypothetical protein
MVSFKEFLQEGQIENITGERFMQYIAQDPSWCKNLSQPVAVTGDLHLDNSSITHLSPLLTFEGKVLIVRCSELEVATGIFKNGCEFNFSDIHTIQDMLVLDTHGLEPFYLASFYACDNLKVATGTYDGPVTFSGSGIEEIKNLNIRKASSDGAVYMARCKKLKTATGTYPGYANFYTSGVTEIKDLHILAPNNRGYAADFRGCDIQKISNFTYEGKIEADDKTLKLIGEYEAKIAAEKIVGPNAGPLGNLF